MKFFFCIVAAVALSSCKQENAGGDPEKLTHLADTMYSRVWVQGETVVNRKSLSPLEDRFLDFFQRAKLIEIRRRIIFDSLMLEQPLDPRRMKTKLGRDTALTLVESAGERDAAESAKITGILDDYEQFLTEEMTVQNVTDENVRSAVLSRLVKREYFVPKWRAVYDSLSYLALRQYRDIIGFLDTTSPHIVFSDTSMNFRRVSDGLRYRTMVRTLDSIAAGERELIERMK